MSAADLVSVVIPTRNSAATLRACLESVAGQTYRDVETIVVDRGSTDATRDLAAEFGARVMTQEPERSAQRNAGARAARGRWVFFVDSDMVLGRSVVEDCVRSAEDGSAVVVPEVGFSDTLFVRARGLEKRCYIGDEAAEAARFFPRDRVLDLGGYDEGLTAGEDWDLTDRWRADEGALRRTRSVIHHDDRALSLGTLLRKRFRYGRLFARYVRKDGSRSGRRLGPGRLRSLLRGLRLDPVAGVVLIGLKALETVCFGSGLLVGLAAPGAPVPHAGSRTD